MIQTAILDVDGVLADLSNERGQLANLRSSLQSRRDRTVSRLNAAALITGSGLGVAVNATQFSTLSNRTENIGDVIGVGSGVVSTTIAQEQSVSGEVPTKSPRWQFLRPFNSL